MALVELTRVTGERRYLNLAKRMLGLRAHGLLGDGRFGPAYWQDHEPVRTAAEVAGRPQFAPHLADYAPGWRFRGVEETERALGAAGFSDLEVEIDSVEESPDDAAGYLRTAPLLCYLELLPDDLHDSFVDEVVAELGPELTIDHSRLKVVARRPSA